MTKNPNQKPEKAPETVNPVDVVLPEQEQENKESETIVEGSENPVQEQGEGNDQEQPKGEPGKKAPETKKGLGSKNLRKFYKFNKPKK